MPSISPPERPLHVVHVTDGTSWAGMESHLLHFHRAARHRTDLLCTYAFSDDTAVAGIFRSEGARVVIWRGRGLARMRGLRRLLRDTAPDVIHLHGYLAVISSTVAAPELAGSRFVTLHASVDRTPRPTEAIWWYSRLARVCALASGARFLAVSDSVARDHAAHGIPRRRIQVVHNGIAPQPTAERGSGHGPPPRIGFVGRLAAVKDPRLFLETAARVARAWPRSRFLVAGDGPLRHRLGEHAERLGIAERVQFLGQVADSRSLMHQLDLLLVTSRSEGIPYSVLEALASGVACVAVAVGGLREILAHGTNALLAGSRDPEELSRLCVAALADPSLRRRLSEGGRRCVEGPLSARAMVDRTVAIYRKPGSD